MADAGAPLPEPDTGLLLLKRLLTGVTLTDGVAPPPKPAKAMFAPGLLATMMLRVWAADKPWAWAEAAKTFSAGWLLANCLANKATTAWSWSLGTEDVRAWISESGLMLASVAALMIASCDVLAASCFCTSACTAAAFIVGANCAQAAEEATDKPMDTSVALMMCFMKLLLLKNQYAFLWKKPLTAVIARMRKSNQMDQFSM